MSEHGRNVKETLAPGLWIDMDETWHFDGVKFCEGLGLPPTPENLRNAEDAIKVVMRERSHETMIIDVFGPR